MSSWGSSLKSLYCFAQNKPGHVHSISCNQSKPENCEESENYEEGAPKENERLSVLKSKEQM